MGLFLTDSLICGLDFGTTTSCLLHLFVLGKCNSHVAPCLLLLETATQLVATDNLNLYSIKILHVNIRLVVFPLHFVVIFCLVNKSFYYTTERVDRSLGKFWAMTIIYPRPSHHQLVLYALDNGD